MFSLVYCRFTKSLIQEKVFKRTDLSLPGKPEFESELPGLRGEELVKDLFEKHNMNVSLSPDQEKELKVKLYEECDVDQTRLPQQCPPHTWPARPDSQGVWEVQSKDRIEKINDSLDLRPTTYGDPKIKSGD